MFDKIHGDGVPWFLRNRELLKSTVGLVAWCLGSPTSRARPAVVLDKLSDTWPCIISTNKIQSLVEGVMTGERMVVLVSEDTESEVGVIWNINAIVQEEKT